MDMEINGYYLPYGLTTENAGMCQWGFAWKDGHEYFMKEFLSPKYPLDSQKLGPELTKKMRQVADDFYRKKQNYYQHLQLCRTGNVLIPVDFFRWGAKYYTVTDKVQETPLTVQQIAELSEEGKNTLVLSLLYSMARIHEEGIVHSDLRPENILVKTTENGFCTAKIIDFDAGFLENEEPGRIEGSQNYFSPEAVKRIGGAEVPLTTKSDVWALGLLLHQYWCGSLPEFGEMYHYAAEAVLDHAPLVLDKALPNALCTVISDMLQLSPENRPTAREAWERLRRADRFREAQQEPRGLHIPDDLD